MNKDQLNKQEFVNRLSYAFKCLERDVDSLCYREDGGEENVRIKFSNGYTKSLKVTGCEPIEMLRAIVLRV